MIKPKLEGLNILVTGGAGFIGSNLVKKISELNVAKLIVVDNMILSKIGGEQRGLEIIKSLPPHSYKFIQIDASNYKAMKDVLYNEKIDVVFNLAILPLPLSIKRPKYVFDKNIRIASVMAELLRKGMYKTLVHFSSSEVYGSAKYVPMDEDHPLEPSTAYGASKAAQDLLLLSYFHTYGVDIRIIRPFNNIGVAQNDFSYSAVVPRTIRRILENKPPEVFGDGLQTRDFICVEDTCEAGVIIAGENSLKGQVINIASGTETRILDLIKKICELMNYQGEIVFKPARPGDIRRHFANITKARELLGFKPIVTLEEALKVIIRWYSNK